LIKISKDFATLWTTIDPIGNVALFAGLTASLTRSERHLTALRATIYATVIPRGRRDRRADQLKLVRCPRWLAPTLHRGCAAL